MAAGSVMPCCMSIAASPDTGGAACDVPMKKKYASESKRGATNCAGGRSNVSTREMSSVCWRMPPALPNAQNSPPGAANSTQVPELE